MTGAPRLMGVLNLTPDSFSDGGDFTDIEVACRHARQMWMDGAALIDVGGESSRPGAALVGLQEELDRVLPVVERLVRAEGIAVSIDTRKPRVMTEALKAGAVFVNDVGALSAPDALEAVAGSTATVCLMHMQGTPDTMQNDPHYDDVVESVYGFLDRRVAACVSAGIPRDRLVADPGFGFGKTVAHNWQLLRQLRRFGDLGLPIMVGLSRKSMLGAVVDRPPKARLAAGLAATVLAVQRGASWVRTHDVAATADALRVLAQDAAGAEIRQ